MWSKFFAMLGESIFGTDIYILLCAMVTAVLFSIACVLSFTVKKRNILWKQKENPDFSGWTNFFLTISYSLFLTSVSLFPLLGMLGTVASLVTLDFSTGNMADVRNNFFSALTSTAWGILCSIGFKVLNALASAFIEEQIDFSKKCSENSDNSVLSSCIGE